MATKPCVLGASLYFLYLTTEQALSGHISFESRGRVAADHRGNLRGAHEGDVIDLLSQLGHCHPSSRPISVMHWAG